MRDRTALSVEHELFVRTLFITAPPERVIAQLTNRIQDATFEANEFIFERDSVPDLVYFIVDGKVALEAPKEEPWLFEAKDLIGIVDAILERPRTRSARAITPVRLVYIAYEDYIDIFEDNLEFVETTLQEACRLIYQQTHQLPVQAVFGPDQLGQTSVAAAQSSELVSSLLILRHVDALKSAPIQSLVTLADHATIETWPPQQTIFRRGDPNGHLYIVMSGRVAVTSESPRARGIFAAGGLLSAHASIGFDTHQHTAESQEATTALRIDKSALFEVIEDHFGVGRALFAWIARENERSRRISSQDRLIARK